MKERGSKPCPLIGYSGLIGFTLWISILLQRTKKRSDRTVGLDMPYCVDGNLKALPILFRLTMRSTSALRALFMAKQILM